MTKQSTREGFLGNFRWGSVLRRAAFGGDEPWDTFMSNLRSIPLIIDTEVKVGLSFQRGGTVEKKSWCSPSIFRSILDLIARYHTSTVFNFSNYRANPFSDWRSGKIWKDSLVVFSANESNAFS